MIISLPQWRLSNDNDRSSKEKLACHLMHGHSESKFSRKVETELNFDRKKVDHNRTFDSGSHPLMESPTPVTQKTTANTKSIMTGSDRLESRLTTQIGHQSD